MLNINKKEVEILPDGRMSARSACTYLGISEKTLATMRCNGSSPKFIKLGSKVFYFKNTLDKWIADLKEYNSTAESRLNKGGKYE